MAVPARRRAVHPDLWFSYGSAAVLAGVLASAALGLVGLSLVAAVREGARWALLVPHLLCGAVLGLAASPFLRALGWYRRSTALLETVPAQPMYLRMVTNSRGGLFLELHGLVDPGLHATPRLRFQAQVPSWDVARLEGARVEVHADQDPSGPVVVRTPLGNLWAAPLSRRLNYLEGRLR